MKTQKDKRILALILTLTMMLSMVLVFTVSGNAAASNTYVLDAEQLTAFGAGAKYDGQYEKGGTDNYFTLFYTSKSKIEGSDKKFTEGDKTFTHTKRISWGAASEIGDEIENAIKIKTSGAASIKIWWVNGGAKTGSTDIIRQVAIFSADGKVVDQTHVTEIEKTQSNTDGIKNDPLISTLKVSEAGIYYIGNIDGSNYFHMIEVTETPSGETPADRAAWSGVASPIIKSAADDKAGNIAVSVDALIGHDGADELLVSMYDAEGNLIITKGSITEKASHTLTFSPENSGKYTFKTELRREGEASKTGSDATADFIYPLAAPKIVSVTSIGNGNVEVVWNQVHEAESYAIYQDGVKVATVDKNTITYKVSGLTIDQEYSFAVSAIRGAEEKKASPLSVVASLEARRAWGFTAYGESAKESLNGYEGSINDDGSVTLWSKDNGGKIKPDGTDGVAFYYTAIPTEYNFKIRARVTINSWKYTNGQEGFGILVTDRLGEHGNTDPFWNNSYLAGSTKIEYKYDSDNDELIDIKIVNPEFRKFSMKLGIGTISRTGLTKENIELVESNDTDAINKYFVARNYTLDRTAADICNENGTYNVIGNYEEVFGGCLEERFLITEYIIEVDKNNSGYFIRYYDKDGKFMSEKKYYDPDALNQLDENFVYAGFFTARNANVTYSDVELTTILASEDDRPIEYPDITYINPQITVNSGNVTTNENYELIIDNNCEGYLTVIYKDKVIADNVEVAMNERFRTNITLLNYDENPIKIEFTPNMYQELPEFTEISSAKTVYSTFELMYNRGNYHRKTLYISPDVKPHTTTADGTRENPFDIFTALENAYPGQTLILMEGTYKPGSALKIQRGMDGTEDAMIRLIGDPEADTRPVIDFEGLYAGLTHGGDYWYFRGFDVTGSLDTQKGFQISGNHNILDQINTYYNGNTGIQISRLSGADLWEDWPSYNLVLNCTSYCNFDSGFEDADGFAAKLTVGEGNVFDGCIAYNNADDGWDLYAKVESGPIGSVTVRNCVSFDNGTVPGYEKHGNGNGFKLGGESLGGKHVIENSIAWNNYAKGIDSNSCPDIIVKDCISFNNRSHNVALYTNTAKNTAFVASGVISFRTDVMPDMLDNLKHVGDQVIGDYKNSSTYYYESVGTTANTEGVKITADMFVSLEFTEVTRNADGTINLNGFLQLKDNAPANVQNCKLNGPASEEIKLLEDEECSFSKAWYKLDIFGHWHMCECGNKKDIALHDLMWIIDKQVDGNIPGEKHQECMVCGHKKASITIYPDVDIIPTPPTPDDTTNPPESPEEPEKLNFFQRIWQAIINFFRRLFGLDKKAYSLGYYYWL